MEKNEDLNKGLLIKAGIVSRSNALNGKYKAGKLGLENLVDIKDSDIFFLETLRMKADLADKMIAEAESQGKNTTDPNVMKELGEKINSIGTPLHRSERIIGVIVVSLHLMAYYGIAISIWGLVFKKSFLIFGLYGVIAGLLISLLSAAPVVAFQRTKERTKDIIFGVGGLLGGSAMIIGILGIVIWLIRTIFFI